MNIDLWNQNMVLIRILFSHKKGPFKDLNIVFQGPKSGKIVLQWWWHALTCLPSSDKGSWWTQWRTCKLWGVCSGQEHSANWTGCSGIVLGACWKGSIQQKPQTSFDFTRFCSDFSWIYSDIRIFGMYTMLRKQRNYLVHDYLTNYFIGV